MKKAKKTGAVKALKKVAKKAKVTSRAKDYDWSDPDTKPIAVAAPAIMPASADSFSYDDEVGTASLETPAIPTWVFPVAAGLGFGVVVLYFLGIFG